jgi:uncharacterized membrane protein YphA (DoxX/SURF4 family)
MQVMLACSTLIIAKRYPFYATIGLFGVVVTQGFGYGLIFDLTFFLRNLSVMGGLLMALSDALSGKKSNLVGVPTMGINDQDRKKYFQLFGRVLLVFLFLGFVFNGQTGWAKGMVSVSGLVACLFVALGYKAKQSALFLVIVLGTFNFTVNAWWRVHKAHPQRDFLKYVTIFRFRCPLVTEPLTNLSANRYDFFQTLCTFPFSFSPIFEVREEY